MRVVWKDSCYSRKTKKPRTYRGIEVKGLDKGWSSGLAGDTKIYRTYPCAQNAIDKVLGGHGTTGTATLRNPDIQILVDGKWVKIE